MSYYHNVNMSNVCFTLDAAAKMLEAKTPAGSPGHEAAISWKHKGFQQGLKSIRSVDGLRKSHLMRQLTTDLAAFEPLFAFEALAGGREERELYFAIAMWTGFTPIEPRMKNRKIEKFVLDYLSERSDQQDKVLEAMENKNGSTKDCQFVFHMLKDDQTFIDQYGYDYKENPVITQFCIIERNWPMKTRFSFFKSNESLKALRAKFPTYAIIENKINFDIGYLNSKLKREFQAETIAKRAETIVEKLQKQPAARPLKRRPKRP